MMKRIILVVLALISIACSKKSDSYDKKIEKALALSQSAFKNIQQNSTGLRAIGGKDISRLDAKIESMGKMPSVMLRARQKIDKNRFQIVRDQVEFFRNGTSSRAPSPQCSNFDIENGFIGSLDTDIYTKYSPEILKVAEDLGSPNEIYNFVKNEISNIELYGATQTASNLLVSKEGSVVDKANLLAALFKAKKIPTYFVRGEIYLTSENAKRFFGAGSIDDVFSVISAIYGKDFILPGNYQRDFFKAIGGVNYIIIPHVWIKALIGGSWAIFDPTRLPELLPNNAQLGILGDRNRLDVNKWLFGTDSDGKYIKAKTVIDFILETAEINLESSYIETRYTHSNQNEFSTIISDVAPCMIDSFNKIEGGVYEFRGEVILKDKTTNAELFRINEPYVNFSEKVASLTHSAGLLSDIPVGSPPIAGSIQFKLDNQVIGQYASLTGVDYNIEFHAIYPASMTSEEQDYPTSGYTAGGVVVYHLYARTPSQIELINAIEGIQKDISSGLSNSIMLAKLQKFAIQIYLQLEKKSYEAQKVLRGLEYLPINKIETFTVNGKIIANNQQEKELGVTPISIGIGHLSLGPPIKFGPDTDFDEYVRRFDNFRIESLLSASDDEATVWEKAFGLRGYSAVRASQLAGKINSQSPGAYSFIIGERFNSTGSTNISSKIAPGSNLMDRWPGIVSEFGEEGYTYWGPNKEVTDPETGAKVLGYTVYPDPDKNGGAAFFTMLTFGARSLEELKNSKPSVESEGFSFDKGFKNTKILETVFGVNSERGGGSGEFIESPLDFLEGLSLNLGAPIPGAPRGMFSCNPVDYASGLMWHTFTDFNLKGRSQNTGLFFERTYYTLKQYQEGSNWTALGDFGKGWVHNFDSRLLSGAKSNGHLTMAQLGQINNDILWITPNGNTVLLKYLSPGVYESPSGFNGKLSVDSANLILTIKGNTKYFFKNDSSSNIHGRLVKILDPHGEFVTLSYDSSARLLKVSSATQGDLDFVRDGSSKLIRVDNVKNKLSVSFEYQNSQLSASFDIDGNKTAYEYNSSQPGKVSQGLLSTIIDPLGREIKFDYYQNGKVFKETGHGNAVQAYQYAPYLYQKYTKVMSSNGESIEYRYDDNFRAVLEVYPDAGRIHRKWNSNGLIEWERDQLGYKTEFNYDSKGNRTGIKKPLDSDYYRVDYDQTFDIPSKETPLLGSPITYGINQSTGDVQSIAQASGADNLSTQFTYDSFGTRLTTKHRYGTFSNQADSNGLISYEYDNRNPISNKYDSRHRLIEKKFASGRVINLTYDKFDRLTSVIDTHGPTIENYYDVVGRLISKKRKQDGVTHSTNFEYDDRDRLISETDFAGRKTSYVYDRAGVGCLIIDKPVKVTTPDGNVTKYTYDSMGRKTSETLPDGSKNYFVYNLRGELTMIVDAMGNNTIFEYDANGRLVKKQAQSVGMQNNLDGDAAVGYLPEIVNYYYDKNGRIEFKEQINVSESQLGGRYLTAYSYDDLGRLKQKKLEYRQGSKIIEEIDTIGYKYYPLISPTLVSEITNKYITYRLAYETQPPYSVINYIQEPTVLGTSIGLQKYSHRVVPGQTGPIDRFIRDGATLLKQEYDSAGKLRLVSGSYSGMSTSASISYDGYGRRSNTVVNGVAGAYQYDSLDRLTGLNWNTASSISMSISYYTSGNIRTIFREFGYQGFGYNKKNELISFSTSPNETQSSYLTGVVKYYADGTISEHGTVVRENFSNFLTKAKDYYHAPPETITNYYPTSDGTGRVGRKFVSSSEVHNYRYFPEGQLRNFIVQSSSGVVSRSANYYYDGLGRRIAKEISIPGESKTVITYTHLGMEDRILTARVKKGFTQKDALYVDGAGIDEHLFEISSDSGIKAFITDHVGSVLNSAAIGGKPVYGLFGENAGTAVSISVFSEPVTYGFTGREYDNESGLYYYRARYYDPTAQRFMSRDPLGPHEGGDINPYRYAKNNPVNFTDPLGLKVDGPVYTPVEFNAILTTNAGQTAMNNGFIKSDIRYIYTEQGVIDMRHAQAAFNNTQSLMSSGVPASLAGAATYAAGLGVEVTQALGFGSRSYGNVNSSAFSPEDIPSNVFGISGARSTGSFGSFVNQIKQPNYCRRGY